MGDAAKFGITAAHRDTSVKGRTTSELKRGGVGKREVSYWDFTSDGQSVFAQISALPEGELDFVGVIRDAWPVESVEAIQRLLGAAAGDLPDGRTSLYGCPECGDLGCGAISARIEFENRVVVWKELGWQTDYGEGFEALDPENAVRFSFDRPSYESVLRGELERQRTLSEGFEYPHERERITTFIFGKYMRNRLGRRT